MGLVVEVSKAPHHFMHHRLYQTIPNFKPVVMPLQLKLILVEIGLFELSGEEIPWIAS